MKNIFIVTYLSKRDFPSEQVHHHSSLLSEGRCPCSRWIRDSPRWFSHLWNISASKKPSPLSPYCRESLFSPTRPRKGSKLTLPDQGIFHWFSFQNLLFLRIVIPLLCGFFIIFLRFINIFVARILLGLGFSTLRDEIINPCGTKM